MSDDNNNEAATPLVNGEGALPNMPQMRVLAQYIKDFSFENPNAPNSLREGVQPKVDIQLDVGARTLDENGVFEVDLKINAKSEREGSVLFVCELVYSGVFQFNNITQETLEPILLIECPRTLFPFARQIVAETSQNGGYPPLMIDPMDFAALYFAQKQNQAGQAGNA